MKGPAGEESLNDDWLYKGCMLARLLPNSAFTSVLQYKVTAVHIA